MDPQELLLTGVLAPALAAGVLLGLGWKVWRREDADSDGRWSGAPALAIAFLLTFYLLSGMPVSLLPDSPRTPTGLDWLAWLAVPAIFLLPLEQKLGRWKHLLRGVVAIAMVRLVLNTAFESTFEANAGGRWLAGLSALYVLLWAALTRVCGQRTGASSPLVLWTMAAGLAVLAALTGSAKIGQLGGALAAALGAATVLAWCRPRLTLAGGGVGLALLLLFGLGMNAHVYSYTESTEILLIASAPLFALLADLPPLRFKRPALRTLVVVLLTALPIGIAITRAAMAFAAESDEYGDYYDY